MSAFKHNKMNQLTADELNEMQVLKEAISFNPASVHFMKMERFTELFTRSIVGKGENCIFKEPTNY